MKKKNVISPDEEPGSFDWNAIHTRMEAARAGIERWANPTDEEKKAIFKARAKALARFENERSGEEKNLEIVEFLLADGRYGIEISYLRETYPLKEITALPGTPSFVLGLINVRGQILSVFDIKKLFALPDKALTTSSKIIIIGYNGMEFGIIADAVIGVRNVLIEETQISFPPAVSEYLQGVTKEGVVILDAEKILSDSKLIVHEEVGS